MSSVIARRGWAGIEPLEGRRLMAVAFAIDAGASVHPISRFIYGVNSSLAGGLAQGTLERLGGNRWTAYNWENNASNAGSDYQYQNDAFLGGGNTPGGAVMPGIADASAHGAGTLLTIPMAGYVSADKNPGGDVRNSGSNYLSTRFKQMVARKGSAFSLTPDPTDGNVYADEFVNWVKTNYPYAATDPNRPIWFDLDNEPDLWSSTHAEIHPAKVTYAELISKSIEYSKAIKDVMPGTKVFGPASYGWNGYTTLQDATDAGGRDFLNTYLAQMKSASDSAGKRLLDELDLHWYPEAQGGGVRITANDTSAAVVAARLQAPRSLWDPTYTETSWITQYSTNGPIDLIHRMQGKIAANYAGTGLSISEYNYGAGGSISGGIAQADVLGIFGREGVFSANQWPLISGETYVAGAFQMFRNFDGAGGGFGDTSVKATTSDVAGSSVYASLDSSNPNVMVIVAINKTAATNVASVSLAGRSAASGQMASVYQLTGSSAAPVAGAGIALGAGTGFSYSMPAYSVTTIRVPLAGAGPKVTASSFDFAHSPNSVKFTFDADVSASLSAGDLKVTRGMTGIGVTGVNYDSASNTATFLLPAGLVDGDYRAVLSGSGVSANGAAMGADQSLDFFVLGGDANRDRTVDFSDLTVLAQHYNMMGGMTFTQGDFNFDGNVDFSDLTILAQRYNTSIPVAAGASARVGAMPVQANTTLFSMSPVVHSVGVKRVKACTKTHAF